MAKLDSGQTIRIDLRVGRKGCVQVADGSLNVNGIPLFKGDGLAIDGSSSLTFDQGKAAEINFDACFDIARKWAPEDSRHAIPKVTPRSPSILAVAHQDNSAECQKYPEKSQRANFAHGQTKCPNVI